MTHLQILKSQDLHKISSAGGFWHLQILGMFLALNAFQLWTKKQKL